MVRRRTQNELELLEYRIRYRLHRLDEQAAMHHRCNLTKGWRRWANSRATSHRQRHANGKKQKKRIEPDTMRERMTLEIRALDAAQKRNEKTTWERWAETASINVNRRARNAAGINGND